MNGNGANDYWTAFQNVNWQCGICHHMIRNGDTRVLTYKGNPLLFLSFVEINLKYCGDNIICAMGALEKCLKGEL